MKDCNVNSKFNCSPYIKYIFMAFIFILVLMSCSQEVRVDDDDLFSDIILLVEDEYNSKILDRNSGQILSSDIFRNGDEKISSNIDKIYSFQNEVYFYLNEENKLKVYNQNDFNFLNEYDFSEIGNVGGVTFPNLSNFYVSLSDKNSVLVVDRINKKESGFYIPVDENPRNMLSIDNLVFVACESSISIIRTGTKEVIDKIILDSKPLLLSTDFNYENLSAENLLVITKEGKDCFLSYYDLKSFTEVAKERLVPGDEVVEEMEINQIAIVKNDFEYSWLGTSAGLFRIDLRNKGVYTFISDRSENVKNIYFEPVSNKLLLLTERNGNKDYIIANSRTGEFESYFLMPNNTKLIYPL